MNIIHEEYYLEMAKLIRRKANSIYGDIGEFIYFSPCNSSHGPRIKFYGGTKETSETRTAPSMKFDVNGNTEVEVFDWMNKKNCPNAFDKTYVENVTNFVKMTYPILLLVWFKRLDEAEALDYFQGRETLQELLDFIDFDNNDINKTQIKTVTELDNVCKQFDLYNF